MEPIILLQTSQSTTTEPETPGNGVFPEVDFQKVLKEISSSSQTENTDGTGAPVDPALMGLLWSMFPPCPEQGNAAPCEMIEETFLGEGSVQAGPPQSTSSLAQATDLGLIQVTEKDILFTGAIVVQEKNVPPATETPESIPNVSPLAEGEVAPSPPSLSNPARNFGGGENPPLEKGQPFFQNPSDAFLPADGARSTVDGQSPRPEGKVGHGNNPIGLPPPQSALKMGEDIANRGWEGAFNVSYEKDAVLNEPSLSHAGSGGRLAEMPQKLPAGKSGTETAQETLLRSLTEEAGVAPPETDEVKVVENVLTEGDKLAAAGKTENEHIADPSMATPTDDRQPSTPSASEVKEGQVVSSPRQPSSETLQQVSKKLLWSVRNGEEKIRMQLEPPQLGNLTIEINRNNDVVKAVLWADNNVTKELLESHQVQLQKILKEDGFQLAQFDVHVDQNMKSFQERREHWVEQHPWAGSTGNNGERLSHSETEVLPVAAHSGMTGRQRIDLFI